MNPTELFERAIDALRREDVRAAVALCDPVSLRAFKRSQIESLTPQPTEHAWTAEMFLRFQPDMPREVAEYQAADAQRQSQPSERFKREFVGITSVDELRDMDPVDVFTSWIEARSARRQLARFVEMGLADKRVLEGAGSIEETFQRFDLIAVVDDGPDVAHIVYRHRHSEPGSCAGDGCPQVHGLPADEQKLVRENSAKTEFRHTRCRRQPDGSWLLHADHDFMGVGSSTLSMGSNDESHDKPPE